MFTSPGTSEGSDVKPADLEGHLLVVEPHEYRENIPTSLGDKDAIRVTVHDITDQTTYEDILWFPRVLVGSLKNRIGQKVLAVLGKGTAKPGQSAPWVLVDASTEKPAVKAATAYLEQYQSGTFTAVDDEIAQVAAESGNPALAAALGKLGARR